MTKPTTAPPATSALVPLGETGVTYNLDAFPIETYNRLIPTQTIQMQSDLMVPIVQTVVLDPAVGEDRKSPDHYSSKDVPSGHRAPTARGLNKLATVAGVSFYDERRIDDGSDPDVIGVSVMASMLLPTGQRVTAPGSQLINIRTWFSKETSAPELAKFRKQFYAHVSTRAKNRAIRGLLSLRSSYPERDIAKPFAVVTYVPNMNNPEVRAAIIATMAPSVAQLYGPSTAPQLAAGQVVEAPEAPEDDDATIEGQAQEVGEPSWFDAAAPTASASASAPAAAGPSPAEHLAAILRQAAGQSGIVGGVAEPQKESLNAIFRRLGGEQLAAGLRIVFGLADIRDITGAQAQALINASNAGDFPDLWRELVATEGAQAA